MADKEDPLLPVCNIPSSVFKRTNCWDKLADTFRNKTKLFWWLLTVRVAVLSWSIYVNSRQVSMLISYSPASNATETFVSEEEYAQAYLIHLSAVVFNILCLLLNIILTILIAFFNVVPWVWSRLGAWLECLHQSVKLLGQSIFVRKQQDKNGYVKRVKRVYYEIEKSVALVLVLTPILATPMVLQLPFTAVTILVSVLMFALFAMASTGLVVYMLQSGGIAMKWLYIWLLFALLPFILNDALLPLLENRSSLDNSTQLYKEISNLASRVEFPIDWIYVSPQQQDLDEDGAGENAYYSGILFNHRIVLTESMLSNNSSNNLTDKEITAIVGHELGHWKLSHLVYHFFYEEVNIFILILLFHHLYRKPTIYRAFGFHNEQPVLIFAFIFFWFIMMPYEMLVTLANNWLSQFGEYKADAFAASLGLGEPLCSALVKLGVNQTLPMDNDWLYSLFKHTHPSTYNRCAVLKAN